MNSVTVNYELNSKKRIDDRHDILIRITKNKKHKRMSTQIKVFKKDFSARSRWGKWVKPSDSMHAVKNEKLKDLYNKAEAAVYKLEKQEKSTSLENVKQLLKGTDKEKSFVKFSYKVAERFKKQQKVNTYKKYIATLNKLFSYNKNVDLTFLDINVEFITEYKVHLSQLGNHINTIAKDLSVIKSIINKAIKEDLLAIEKNPFLKIPIQKTKTFKEKLSQEEIKKIENLSLSPNTMINHSRNAFMFSFYCAGIRFIDVCRLRWENIKDDRIIYKMTKTGETKSLRLFEASIEILKSYQSNNKNDYLFPFLENDFDYSDEFILRKKVSSRNAQVNNNLKKIAKLLEITKPLSFHISRHSFADYARKMGIDMQTIRIMLGHSSLKVTEGYLNSLNDDMMDDAMGEMFN